MTFREIMIAVGLFLCAPLGVKLLDYLISLGKHYFANRKEKLIHQTQSAVDLKKLEQIQTLDLSNISRENFRAINDAAVEMARSAIEQKKLAEEKAAKEELLREKCESDFKSQLNDLETKVKNLTAETGKLQGEHRSCSIILEQVERRLRFLYDSSRIAYWEAKADGKCDYFNQTFLDITGLDREQCINDGWFDAVEESDRSRIRYLWNNFIGNQQTHTQFHFNFIRRPGNGTDEKPLFTRVAVQCDAIMLNGLEVYKYTASTTPLKDFQTKSSERNNF